MNGTTPKVTKIRTVRNRPNADTISLGILAAVAIAIGWLYGEPVPALAGASWIVASVGAWSWN